MATIKKEATTSVRVSTSVSSAPSLAQFAAKPAASVVASTAMDARATPSPSIFVVPPEVRLVGFMAEGGLFIQLGDLGFGKLLSRQLFLPNKTAVQRTKNELLFDGFMRGVANTVVTEAEVDAAITGKHQLHQTVVVTKTQVNCRSKH